MNEEEFENSRNDFYKNMVIFKQYEQL